MQPKVSIITTAYNSAATINDTIQSVLNQNYPNIEHIIIDGLSTDGTMEIVAKYKHLKTISEPDNGLYDAMNKGVTLATGHIICILNSDDRYAHQNVITQVVKHMQNCQGLLTNITIFNPQTNTTIRRYKATTWKNWMFRIGWQPPHPGAFFTKEVYQKYGLFNTNYKISADFDILFRFIYHHKIIVKKANFISVNMRAGGLSQSGLKNLIIANYEDHQAIKSYGYFSLPFFIWLKYLLKAFQFLNAK